MKYLVTIGMLTFIGAFQSNAQFRIGAGTVIGIGPGDPVVTKGLNLSGVYVGEGDFDFGAEFTYWLVDNSSMAVDLNGYYLMKIMGADSDIYISPLAGINVFREASSGAESSAEIKPALNLGVSIKKEVGDRLLILEPKVLVKGRQDMVIKLGFVF